MIIDIIALSLMLAMIYFLVGGALAADQPEPLLDWLFIWPIMLWKEMIKE